MKNVMKKAHEITKNIIRKGDSYRATFRLALIFVHSQIRKGVNKMVELKGSEKQMKWASDIRVNLAKIIDEATSLIEADCKDKWERKGSKKFNTVDEMIKRNIERNEELKEMIFNISDSKFLIENFKSVTSKESINWIAFNLENKASELEEIDTDNKKHWNRLCSQMQKLSSQKKYVKYSNMYL